jgi:UDP-N-acetylmuramoylalanine--D-glutamate ligase
MLELRDKTVVVIGLCGRGRAACELLCRQGARVTAVDTADHADLQHVAGELRALGADVELGVAEAPPGAFDLAVLSPAVRAGAPVAQALARRGVRVIGELELGFQQGRCLAVAVAGTNGKGTTAELIERLLNHSHRRALLAGHRARPVCSVAEETRDLDFLVLRVNAFQLERTEFFRPAVAVLTSLAPDHLDRYGTHVDYARAHARLFRNQQAFDWAIVQLDALRRLQEWSIPVPAKTITYSATDPSADLHLDRGLLISGLPNWSGPLFDTDHCQLHGPHNAENLMAALAVGHVLRIPLETMLDPLKTFTAGPHRLELVAEINGVQYINDSKAGNLDALQKALLAARPGDGGEANIWLIAGGRDKGLEYHDAGPVISRRVKRAILFGEAAEKMCAAWSLFTPCAAKESLLEAISEAARNAASGDVVLFSPACSSLDQFRDFQERGEVFCRAVKSIGRGVPVGHPNRHGNLAVV